MEMLVVLLAFFMVAVLLRPLGVTDPQTLTTASDMLRDDYLPGTAVELSEATPLLKRIKRRSDYEVVGGNQAVMLLDGQPNESTGGRVSGDDLPDAGHSQLTKGALKIAHHYGSFGLDGDVIAAAVKNPGQTIDEIDRQMKALLASMKRLVNHTLYRDGSGLLGSCVSASDSAGKTTIVINAQLNNDGVVPFRPKMPVAVVLKSDGTTGVGVAEAVVYSVDKAGHTITLDRVVGTAASIDSTYGVYRYNSRNKVSYGLGAALGAGNPGTGNDANGYYGGLDRTAAANYWFKGNLLNNGGSAWALTPDLVLWGLQEAEREDGEVTAVYMRPEVWRAWANMIFPSREWGGQIKTIDAGYKAFEYVGIPFVQDWDAPADSMVFVPEGNLALLENEGLQPLNPDGNILRQDGSKDRWKGHVVHRFQLECDKPNAGTILQDLAVRQIPTQT